MMSLSGNNAPACSNSPIAGDNAIMLFGVRLTPHAAPSSFRKSVSMTNLSDYDQLPQDSNTDVAAGYESDDVVHVSATAKTPDRKRGVPWSEDEHRLFLVGLQKVGKGDWRGISRNFVKTRTPTQVASHAQKYFIRRTNHSRRRRRSSLFDITTDTVLSSSIEEEQLPLSQETSNDLNLPPHPQNKVIRPVPINPTPPSSKTADLNLNLKSPTEETSQLSLKLTTPSGEQLPGGSTTQYSLAFQGLSGGDNIISVA